ncbi:hypothetical protein BCR32DRAFT_327322 [Anaeromyces robustus]|uniref:Uncharacterized protein n=1 Tax=Anaeromyces robustus TaxID=1754192 RepID=A0A1Y1X6M8_9FUNG|nr:hypothetical protein BCR32DRAFT_327322 [Anaeromyces robustus]|eukprot:ORX81362.1 hypothetical protein BCR32DRAFT_327322 [Anaeromyces robustus]
MDQLSLLGLLTLLALGLSSCGFYKFVYFFSLGYGFSISGIGIALLIIYRKTLTFWTILLCILLILYGIRLSGYLLLREIKSAAYRNILKTDAKQDAPFKVKIFVWTSVAILFISMTSPVIYRMNNQNSDDFMAIIGFLISAFGFFIEVLADHQKTQVKKRDSKMFASEGLYKIVRCPNYFGELVIWFGILISGFTIYNSIIQWIIALLGYTGITFVMFSGARRLEIRQDKSYGNNPNYQEYKMNTRILIPFLPIYTVKKYKWLVA